MKKVLLLLMVGIIVIGFSLQEVTISDFNQKTVNIAQGESSLFIKIEPSVLASLYQLTFQITSKGLIKTYSVFDSLPDKISPETEKI